jgi:hypothetical protein
MIIRKTNEVNRMKKPPITNRLQQIANMKPNAPLLTFFIPIHGAEKLTPANRTRLAIAAGNTACAVLSLFAVFKK